MAVITPSALISEIRGSVGLQTFSKNRYGAYVKGKLVQVNPNTIPQQGVRTSLAAAIAAWQALTQADQDKWINFADTNVVGKNISRKIKRAGYNEFVSRWQNRLAIAGAGTGYDPLPKVRLYPKLTAISQAAANLSITFDTLTAIGNCDLAVYATPPISPGINNINPNFFRIIGKITPGAQIETVNIYAMYTALFPLAAPDIGQKIGIAIRAINTDNYAGGGFFFTQTIIGASLISNFTTEYQAILDYAILQGYTLPSVPVQTLQNQLVEDLISNSLWSNRTLLYVFAGDGDEDFACINWTNPGTFQCTRHGGLTYTVNVGFEGNGTNAWLNTHHKPVIDGAGIYTQNSANIIYFSTTPLVATYSGLRQATGPSLLTAHTNNLTSIRLNASGQVVNFSAGNPVNGAFSSWDSNRNGSHNQTVRRNKILSVSGTSVSGVIPSVTLGILARNTNTVAEAFSQGDMNIYSTGSKLTDIERDTQHDIFFSYLNSL